VGAHKKLKSVSPPASVSDQRTSTPPLSPPKSNDYDDPPKTPSHGLHRIYNTVLETSTQACRSTETNQRQDAPNVATQALGLGFPNDLSNTVQELQTQTPKQSEVSRSKTRSSPVVPKAINSWSKLAREGPKTGPSAGPRKFANGKTAQENREEKDAENNLQARTVWVTNVPEFKPYQGQKEVGKQRNKFFGQLKRIMCQKHPELKSRHSGWTSVKESIKLINFTPSHAAVKSTCARVIFPKPKWADDAIHTLQYVDEENCIKFHSLGPKQDPKDEKTVGVQRARPERVVDHYLR